MNIKENHEKIQKHLEKKGIHPDVAHKVAVKFQGSDKSPEDTYHWLLHHRKLRWW